MLSLAAMVLAGDWWLGALAGKTVIAAFAPLTALGLLAAGRRFFSLTRFFHFLGTVVSQSERASTPAIGYTSGHKGFRSS